MRSQTNIGVTPPLVVATIGRDPFQLLQRVLPRADLVCDVWLAVSTLLAFTTHHRFEINGEECHRLQLVELSAVSRR